MITTKTRRIYDFITRYNSANNETPTLVEIGRHVGMSSVSGVHKHIVILEREGLITRKRKAWRAIRVVEEVES